MVPYADYLDAILRPMRAVAYTTPMGLRLGYLSAYDVAARNIGGAIVECGVAQGAQIGAMALALKHAGQVRDIHLFDSFEGIPMAGPKDAEQPGIGAPVHDVNAPIESRLVSSGVSIGAIEQVKANIASWGIPHRYHYHEGWFQHTLPSDAKGVGPIALLRLDGDLYESTRCCLEHLYEQVVPGGLVIIDDYALAGCRLAVEEFIADRSGIDLDQQDIGGGATIATWMKR